MKDAQREPTKEPAQKAERLILLAKVSINYARLILSGVNAQADHDHLHSIAQALAGSLEIDEINPLPEEPEDGNETPEKAWQRLLVRLNKALASIRHLHLLYALKQSHEYTTGELELLLSLAGFHTLTSDLCVDLLNKRIDEASVVKDVFTDIANKALLVAQAATEK